MEVAEPCPICHQEMCADECKSALVTYFSLLERVAQRVLSDKAASNVGHLPIIGAGIDKLDGYFHEPIDINIIKTKARVLGFSYEVKPLKNKIPHLIIKNEIATVQLQLDFHGQHVVKLGSNPNIFKSWDNYLKFLSSIIPLESLKRIKIQRIDLNLDFACPFLNLIQSLDVKNKRKALTFIDDSGERTGVIIGKGKHSLEIYDKAIQNNLSEPYTRIELRLFGKKLPTRLLFEIPSFIQKQSYFDGIEGIAVQFKDRKLTPEQLNRLNEFKSIYSREGFYSAKKSINKQRNFDRDFSNLIKVRNWEIQPSELYRDESAKFFKTETLGVSPQKEDRGGSFSEFHHKKRSLH